MIETRHADGSLDVTAPPIDLSRGADSFREVWSRDADLFTRGQFFLTGQLVDDATSGPAHAYLALEFLVVGYVGAQRTILARGALALERNIATASFADASYNRIAIEARLTVDGATGSGTIPSQANLGITGKFWRS